MAKRELEWAEYESDWRESRDLIFSGREIDAGAFAKEWGQLLLLGGLDLGDEEYAALRGAAVEVGDRRFIIVQDDWPEQGPVIADWPEHDLGEYLRDTKFANFDSHMFGESQAWGAVVDHEGLWLIGGDERFLEAFYRRGPRAQELRDKFVRGVREGEFGPPERAAYFAKRMLALVGWQAELD